MGTGTGTHNKGTVGSRQFQILIRAPAGLHGAEPVPQAAGLSVAPFGREIKIAKLPAL